MNKLLTALILIGLVSCTKQKQEPIVNYDTITVHTVAQTTGSLTVNDVLIYASCYDCTHTFKMQRNDTAVIKVSGVHYEVKRNDIPQASGSAYIGYAIIRYINN